MTDVEHRSLAVGYFNATWDLVQAPERSAEEDREMLARALASRQHWQEAGGTADNLTVGDWQVAHVASLAGFADVAVAFAGAAYDRARSARLATWLLASTAEGMARACAAGGDDAGRTRYEDEARRLLADVDDDEDRQLIESQLASIPHP